VNEKPKNAVKSWQERRWRRARLYALGFTIEQYDKYLETPHWQEFRTLALEDQLKRKGRNYCQRCERDRSSIVQLHVHHVTYERLGEELLDDVEIVCRECHDKEHGRDEVSRHRHFAPGRR
jgi:hypothetical protein